MSTPIPLSPRLIIPGRVYLHFDSAGLQAVRSYDYLGRQQQVDRQFAADYRAAPDWTSLDGLATDALEPQAKGLLEPETFTTSYTHDVLGRQVRRTDPDGGAQITAYGVRGLPAQITTQRPGNALPQDVLASMTFDASGRPINAAFANGTTDARLDPASGRLTASTTLPPKGPPLRDISYRHDPVSNPTGANDAAQQTRFFANAVVSPDMSFTYDATTDSSPPPDEKRRLRLRLRTEQTMSASGHCRTSTTSPQYAATPSNLPTTRQATSRMSYTPRQEVAAGTATTRSRRSPTASSPVADSPTTPVAISPRSI